MDLNVTTINDKINHDILLNNRRAKREMAKKGFVNVDGTIMQYNPTSTMFLPVNNMEAVQYFNWIIGTSWQTMKPGNIIDYIKSELPKLTKKDVSDFGLYVQQNQIIINEELITDLMKEAIQDNEVYKNPKADFKGKLNLQTELMVLRNNDIYTDGQTRLFKLKDGKFEIYNTNNVLGLFRSTIGTENTKLVLQYVKNNWRTYTGNLTNVSVLLKLLKEKELKADTLERTVNGYENVLKVISGYGGK